jgi:hypothetical protein
MSDHYLDPAKGEADIAIRSGHSRTKTWSVARSERPVGAFTRAAPMSNAMVGHNELRTSSVISWSRWTGR